MAEYHDTFLDGNELIEAAIDRYYKERSKETLIAILDTIRQRMHADGHFIIPVLVDEEDENSFAFRTIQTKELLNEHAKKTCSHFVQTIFPGFFLPEMVFTVLIKGWHFNRRL